MNLTRRLAWILFLMALPGLLLAMRVRQWKKQQVRLACAVQIERLQALPVSEGLTKRDTLARELGALRTQGRREGDRSSRRCRKRLFLLPHQDQVACLKHGLPRPPPAIDLEPAGWLDPATGQAASVRRQLELAGVADRSLLARASDHPRAPPTPLRRCGHECVAGPTWLMLILAGCLGYAWMLLRALKALLFAALGWPDPFAAPGAPTAPEPHRADGFPPIPGT